MNAPVAVDHPAVSDALLTSFTVPGMRCAGCISKIERGLGELSGVTSARVNFSSKRVSVLHESSLSEDGVLTALRNLGFEAEVADPNPLATDDRETKRLFRSLAVAGFGMMNIMLLSVAVWSGASGVTRDMFHWLSAMIAIPVIAYAGRPFFASALMALRRRRTNMDVPISIGVLLATALSIYETASGGEHAYFDSAVMLLFFLLCGRALDAMMRSRTRAGIGALLGRMGKSASVVQLDGSLKRIEAINLEPGMLMSVAAGEALAADGTFEGDVGAIDNSMLTGESTPVPLSVGDHVHAGALNLLGPLSVRITGVAGDTAIAGIARLMDDAGQSRSHYVRIADRASRLYAPAVHAMAALSFVGWMMAGAGLHQSLVIAIAVLIITCPCAMGLAVPAAQVVASNTLVRHGLLVKDGSALERLAEVDIALFDKTGTLTLGEPAPDLSALGAEAKTVALALAQHSRHPISRSLAATLSAQGILPATVANINESAGDGMSGQWNGKNVFLGRPSTDDGSLACDLSISGKTYTLRLADSLRADAAETLAAFTAMEIASKILSGDRHTSVQGVADTLGIEALSAMTPASKLAELNRLKEEGYRPLMIGDGLNDGPALAAAHASIAPSNASDASQQAADAVFIGTRLAPVALAVKVARSTMAIVRQNFVLAIGYNVLAVPLAIAGLVTPIIAAIAMSCSSLIVVANSLRLARITK